MGRVERGMMSMNRRERRREQRQKRVAVKEENRKNKKEQRQKRRPGRKGIRGRGRGKGKRFDEMGDESESGNDREGILDRKSHFHFKFPENSRLYQNERRLWREPVIPSTEDCCRKVLRMMRFVT